MAFRAMDLEIIEHCRTFTKISTFAEFCRQCSDIMNIFSFLCCHHTYVHPELSPPPRAGHAVAEHVFPDRQAPVNTCLLLPLEG